MLKNTQLVSDEISEDMASAKEELDSAVPFHTLLDVSANKSKAELAHKGVLSQRQRPSTEALRATVMRKSVSTLSSASDSGFPVRFQTFQSGCGQKNFPHDKQTMPTFAPRSFSKPQFKQELFFQVDSCEDTRENTPDSDSGYVGSVVTVTSSSRTFNPPLPAALPAALPVSSGSEPAASATSPLGAPPKSFLSEMQNVHRRKAQAQAAASAVMEQPQNFPPSSTQNTLADQLRSRLEERRKSKEEETPNNAFVPEFLTANVEKAVKVANDTSKAFDLLFKKSSFS